MSGYRAIGDRRNLAAVKSTLDRAVPCRDQKARVRWIGLALLACFGSAATVSARDEQLFNEVVDMIEAGLAESDAEEWLDRVDDLHREGSDLSDLAARASNWEQEAAQTRHALAEAVADEAFALQELKDATTAAERAQACRDYQLASFRLSKFGRVPPYEWVWDGQRWWRVGQDKIFFVENKILIEFQGEIGLEMPLDDHEARRAIYQEPPGSDRQIATGRRLAREALQEGMDRAALAARRAALAQRASALQAASRSAGNPTARFYLRLLGRYSGWQWAAGTRVGTLVGTGAQFLGARLGMRLGPGKLLAGPVGWVLMLVDVALLGVEDYIIYDDMMANQEQQEYAHRNLLELEQLRANGALDEREAAAAAALESALAAATTPRECQDAIQQAIEEADRNFWEAEAAEKELWKELDPSGERDPMWHPRRFRAGLIRIMYDAAQRARVNAATRRTELYRLKKERCDDDEMGSIYLPSETGSCSAQHASYRASSAGVLWDSWLVANAPHSYPPYSESTYGPPQGCKAPDGPNGLYIAPGPDQCPANPVVCDCLKNPPPSVPDRVATTAQPPADETTTSRPPNQPSQTPEEPAPVEMVTVGIKATQTAIAGGEGDVFAGGQLQFDVGAVPALPIAENQRTDEGSSEGAYKAVTDEDGRASIAVPAYTVANASSSHEIQIVLDEYKGRIVAMNSGASSLASIPEELRPYREKPYTMNGILIVPFSFPKNRLSEFLPMLEQLANVAYIENNQCWPIQPLLQDVSPRELPPYPTQEIQFE